VPLVTQRLCSEFVTTRRITLWINRECGRDSRDPDRHFQHIRAIPSKPGPLEGTASPREIWPVVRNSSLANLQSAEWRAKMQWPARTLGGRSWRKI